MDAHAAALLPDKHAAILCSNIACGNSHSVASALKRLGYTDVRTYPGGIQDWVEAGLPVQLGAVRRAHQPAATA